MATLEQHMAAYAKAQAAGDTEAMNFIRQRAQREVTGAGSFTEKLGAGMQDLVTGTKQLFGQASPDEVREQQNIAEGATGGTLGGHIVRGLGTAALAAPAMLIPGANTALGAAAIGGATGLLEPTTDENVVAGKLKNAGIGALTGGATQGAFNVGGQVLKKALGAAGQSLNTLTQGGRQKLAEQAFASAIPEAERPAAQQALQGAAAVRAGGPMTGVTSGAPITAGAATRNPALLEVERGALEGGGGFGRPIQDLYDQAAQARWQHLQQNVGGDVPKLSQAAQDVYDNFMSSAKMQRPFDAKNALGQEIDSAMRTTHNKTVQAELQRIAEQYKSAKDAGDIGSLHELRMTAFDDALSRLYGSDKKAANLLRNRIEGFKDTFDNEMNHSMGGNQWSKFLDEYGTAARMRDQATAGNELLGGFENLNQTPGGAPKLTGQERKLGTAASDVDKYGNPTYSPQAQSALGTVRREVADQNLPYTQGPRNSATAANLNPQEGVLRRALTAQANQAQPLWRDPFMGAAATAGLTADMLGGGGLGSVVAGGIGLGRRLAIRESDKHAIDIAERLIQLHVDPTRAAQALANMNLPPQVKQGAMRAIASRAMQAVPITGAATATQNR